MRKALAIRRDVLEAIQPLWVLAAAEVSLALTLLASDRLPSILVRSLQLFLRF
jgi:hypothetical protein